MKTKIGILAFLSVVLIGILAFKPLDDKKTIVIDAGHGGHDFGATINDFQEKIIVETIAKKVKELNRDNNTEIVLLREGDYAMELSERVSIINKLNPDLVISLHVNSSENLSKNGVDAYIFQENNFYEESLDKAKKLVEKISGQKLLKGNIENAKFYVLKNSNCPAVILEAGYLSNEKDKNYITSENGQNEIAAKILESVK